MAKEIFNTLASSFYTFKVYFQPLSSPCLFITFSELLMPDIHFCEYCCISYVAPRLLVHFCSAVKEKKFKSYLSSLCFPRKSHCFVEITICKLILKLSMARIRAIGMCFKTRSLRFKMISPTHL